MRAYIFAAIVFFAACSGGESRGQPVAQGAPNTALQPAFAGQTRAPEMRSGVDIEAREIARGLNHPWAIAFLPDRRLLVSERGGRLRVITRKRPARSLTSKRPSGRNAMAHG